MLAQALVLGQRANRWRRSRGPVSRSCPEIRELELHDDVGTEGDRVDAVVDSSLRTEEQSEIAIFWTENTAQQWNRNIAAQSQRVGLSDLETARLLALTNTAMADACYYFSNDAGERLGRRIVDWIFARNLFARSARSSCSRRYMDANAIVIIRSGVERCTDWQ